MNYIIIIFTVFLCCSNSFSKSKQKERGLATKPKVIASQFLSSLWFAKINTDDSKVYFHKKDDQGHVESKAFFERKYSLVQAHVQSQVFDKLAGLDVPVFVSVWTLGKLQSLEIIDPQQEKKLLVLYSETGFNFVRTPENKIQIKYIIPSETDEVEAESPLNTILWPAKAETKDSTQVSIEPIDSKKPFNNNKNSKEVLIKKEKAEEPALKEEKQP